MSAIYLSLGTNIEPRVNYLEQALYHLDKHEKIDIIKKSSIYETKPVGYIEQNDFLNMVIQISTILTPIQLLDVCQQIEKQLGRKREVRFGPRTIDLDLLVFKDKIMNSRRLILPHPRMHERSFVLIPLKEITHHLFIPKIEKTVRELLDQLPQSEHKQVKLWKK